MWVIDVQPSFSVKTAEELFPALTCMCGNIKNRGFHTWPTWEDLKPQILSRMHEVLRMTEGFSQTGLHSTHRVTTTSQHILLTGLAVNATWAAVLTHAGCGCVYTYKMFPCVICLGFIKNGCNLLVQKDLYKMVLLLDLFYQGIPKIK